MLVVSVVATEANMSIYVYCIYVYTYIYIYVYIYIYTGELLQTTHIHANKSNNIFAGSSGREACVITCLLKLPVGDPRCDPYRMLDGLGCHVVVIWNLC